MTKQFNAWRVTFRKEIGYEIARSENIFDPNNHALLYPGINLKARRFVVVDSAVDRHYSEKLHNYFLHHGVEAKVVVLPGGEEYKTLESFVHLAGELEEFSLHRRDEPIIAIGGGVLTDVVGFVASSYRRSVPHLKVPTTLMGYVDASIGIKTGINFFGHKNRLGAFEPPKLVLLDKTFFKTLPRRHILNGLSEIIKLAVIKDSSLLALLEQHGRFSVDTKFQDEQSDAILDRAISGMLEELQPNLYEDDLARKVDFGHTFSYGLELSNGTDLLHGEAVLLDIIVSLMIAQNRGLVSSAEVRRVFELVEVLGMKVDTSLLDPDILWNSLEERTCHRNGLQRVPLPHGLGNCEFINDISRDEIKSVCKVLVDRKVSVV